MRIIDVEQGSQAWLDARVGVLTASTFDMVITPKTGKPSAQASKLAYQTLAEEVLGRALEDASSGFMQRGTEMEEEARRWYEFEREVEVARVGLIVRDDGKVGCSPDGLVGEDGGLEIKCPSAAVHLGYLLGGVADEYRCQLQGSLWVTERDWWDFLSYCPGFPPVLVRIARDEDFIGKLATCVDEVLATIETHRATLRDMGLLQESSLTLSEALAQARAA
ncbi:MAG: lambda exonuclease family protein [Gemmatimonadota bacterium]